MNIYHSLVRKISDSCRELISVNFRQIRKKKKNEEIVAKVIIKMFQLISKILLFLNAKPRSFFNIELNRTLFKEKDTYPSYRMDI